jgi:glycosyltransferase involved in cell wall biosynthesis
LAGAMKLRVLHCIYDDPENPWVGGGGSLRVREIYERLTDHVDVTVATGNFRGARDEEISGIRYRRLGMAAPYALSRLSYGVAASRLVARDGYDVALFDFSVYTPLRIPRSGPVGLVVHMLHGLSAPDRWGRVVGSGVAAVERTMLRRARWIAATSDWLAARVRTLVPTASIHVVRSGVPEEYFTVMREERSHLLYYGRFDVFQKGIDTLLDAFDRLAAAHPAVALVLAGRGKDEREVRRLVDRSRFRDRICIRANPSRSEVLELMSGAVMLVMPSRVEGLPMVAAEAMAAGVPVIASDVGAIAEVVHPPMGGLLVPPDHPSALCRAVEAWLADPAARAHIGGRARSLAERFSWDSVAEQHLEFLRKVAGGSERGKAKLSS